MEFDPKLQTQAQPERLVGAATERGPIGPSTPIDTLTRASRDQVSQARRQVSKLDDDRPVPKVDVFGAIANIAGNVGQGISAISGPAPTQTQKDEAVLKPYATELQKLQSAKLKGTDGVTSRMNILTSETIRENPRLRKEILGLFETFTGRETIVKPELSVEDIQRQNISDFLSKTPEGRVVAARASQLPPSEQRAFIDQNYNRAKVQEATIEQAGIRLQSVKDNQELLQIESDVQSQAISKNQSLQIQELMANEILPEAVDPNEPFDAAQDLESLRELRALKANEFISEYGVGVLPADVEKRVAEVMKPLDRMIDMLEANGDDINRLARIQGNKAVLELGKMLQDEGFGPLFQTPDGIRAVTEGLIHNNQLDVARVAKVYKEKYDLAPNGKIAEAPVSDDGDTSNTFTPEAKRFYGDNPPARRDLVQTSSNVMNGPELDTPENIKISYDAGIELIGAISAGDDVLDDNSFGKFVDQNLFRFVQLATLPGEQGEMFTRALNGMLVKQMAINTWDSKQLSKNLPSGFMINYDGKFKLDFNMKAFENAEDNLTQNVRTALKGQGLPITEENILAVLETPTEFTAKNSPIGGRTSSVDNQSLILGNSSLRNLQSKVGRLNNIDSVAKNVPTIKGWEDEANAAVIREDREFRASQVTGNAVITKDQLKMTEEKRKSYPTFNTEQAVDEALAKGDIAVGDLINMDGEIYVVEE